MLKILVSHHAHPEVTSYTTILFRNVLPILQKTIDIHLIWAIHSNFSNQMKKLNEKSSMLKVGDFQNAVELIKSVKPDLVFIISGLSAPDYAFYLAAKFLNIKIIGGQISGPFFAPVKKKNRFKTYFSQSLQKTSISENNDKEREILKIQGLFKKYVFLFKTMKSVNMKSHEIIHEFLEFILSHASWNSHVKFNSKFKCDAIFVDSEKELNKKIQDGYEKDSLVITGNPSYDQAIKEINKKKIQKNDDGRIRILFLTVNLEGQGGKWTRKKRDFMLKEFLKFCANENYLVSIKIHPSGENLDEYKDITSHIDSKIPIYQKENLIDCIMNANVVFSMSSSTAGLIALFLKKPIIIWNFFNVKNDLFLDNDISLECKNIEKLPNYVKQVLEVNPASEEKLLKIVSDVLYKADGKASERIAHEILKLVKK